MPVDYKKLFESAPGLFLVLDPGLNIVAVSDAYVRATMISRGEVLGRHLFEIFPDNPNDASATGTAQLGASLGRVLKSKTSDAMAIQKYDIRRPDGTFEERYWSPLNTPVLGDDGGVRYIIHRVENVTDLVRLRDESLEQSLLTERLRSENDNLEKLRQSQRMEAMGQLAGGVAHDFNNILATISLTCESKMQKLPPTDSARAGYATILESCERAATLTRQLLAFSRKQVLQPKVLNINTPISGMHGLLTRLLNENIQTQLELSPDLANALIDPGQVEQIVLNLVINARDAMPNGGSLSIRTANADLDSSMSSAALNVKPGRYVLLSVRDTGVGMTAAVQARIFEPFFTTKPQGKGTGLGLATVYGIVQQNQGSIWCYSELGQGTVFKIYLPVHDRPLETPAHALPSVPVADLTGKTILVAEDEKELRHAIVSTLRSHGYSVIEAQDGAEAFTVLGDDPKAVDLIVTDVVMPKMGGQELSRRLASRGIRTKILYLSGYTQDVLDTHGLTESHPHFLEKPFRLDALLTKIREILS